MKVCMTLIIICGSKNIKNINKANMFTETSYENFTTNEAQECNLGCIITSNSSVEEFLWIFYENAKKNWGNDSFCMSPRAWITNLIVPTLSVRNITSFVKKFLQHCQICRNFLLYFTILLLNFFLFIAG